MASGRMHKPGDIHMVTNRCEEGRFFLKPTKEVLDLIAYWFAKAKERYGCGLEIYAFCFLCNHFHLLCRDTTGREQAHFWQGRYDDQIIKGERTFWKKYLANRGAGKKTKMKPKKEFMESFSFELTPPPGLGSIFPKDRGAEIRKMARKAEDHCTARRDRKQAAGMQKVMSVSPFHKPKRLARRPKRRFACDTKEQLHEMLEQFREFIARYKQTMAAFLAAARRNFRGILGEWPAGSFPPSSCYPVLFDSET